MWKKDTPRAARAMVEAGNRINLSVGFDEADLTDEMIEFCASAREKRAIFCKCKSISEKLPYLYSIGKAG